MAEDGAVRFAWHYIIVQPVATINIVLQKSVKGTENYLCFKHEIFSDLSSHSVKLEIQNARILIKISFLVQNDCHRNFV